MSNTQSTAPAPGELFLVPGIAGATQLVEDYDSNQDTTFTINQSAPTTVSNQIPFEQTTIVFGWELELAISQTVTPGTGQTVTTSPYFPYNYIQSISLSLQSTYDLFNNVSGIDLAIFNLIRPFYRGVDRRNNLLVNPAANFATSNLAQPSLQTPTGLSDTSSGFNLAIEVNSSTIIDLYYDLNVDGSPNELLPPHTAIVSPQYMASSGREVTPKLVVPAAFGSGLDTSPFNTTANTASGDTASTYTGSGTINWRRKGVYLPSSPATSPLEYDWQRQLTVSERVPAGATSYNFQIPPEGQLMSLFVRMWDPNANGGLGAPISLSNVTKCEIVTGAKQMRYNDTPRNAQERFLRQHGFLPPVGTLVWDFATDYFGKVTNATAINLITTTGCTVRLKFANALSLTAKLYFGMELLSFVPATPIA